MVAYIAGKITDNLDTYQYDFSDCEMVLKELNYTVLSPAYLPVGLHKYEDYMNISKQTMFSFSKVGRKAKERDKNTNGQRSGRRTYSTTVRIG